MKSVSNIGDNCNIKKNLEKLIESCGFEDSYLEYEMSAFIFYIEKYPDIISEYSEKIFRAYLKCFENIYFLCNKQILAKENNCYYFYMKKLLGRIISKEKIFDLFFLLFKNNNNILDDSNLKFLAFCISGHDVIQCYIKSGRGFNAIQTKILMKSISENPFYDLGLSLISIINDNDSFEYNEELLEYASYIPIVNYVKRYMNIWLCSDVTTETIEKKYIINSKSFNNLLAYFDDIELLNKIYDKICDLHFDFIIDEKSLEHACKSYNIQNISFILNNKILPNKKSIEICINIHQILNSLSNLPSTKELFKKEYYQQYKILKFDDNDNDVFLYCEIDKFNNTSNYQNPLLLRKINQKSFVEIKEILKLFEKYGYIYTNDDLLIAIQNRIHFDNFNFDNFNDTRFLNQYINTCRKNSYYPYLTNKKYPKPNKLCLYNECKKNGNTKLIKRLCEDCSIDPDIECLKLACSVDNNMFTIKYLIEKKNISPNIDCIKNNIALFNKINKNNIFEQNDNKKIKEIVFLYGNNISQYIFSKLSANKSL
jgi:hypothetical protein